MSDSDVLGPALLATDEEQYDKHATSLVAKLDKLPVQQLASKDALDVGAVVFHLNAARLTSDRRH